MKLIKLTIFLGLLLVVSLVVHNYIAGRQLDPSNAFSGQQHTNTDLPTSTKAASRRARRLTRAAKRRVERDFPDASCSIQGMSLICSGTALGHGDKCRITLHNFAAAPSYDCRKN